MAESHKLLVTRETFERFSFQSSAVVTDVVKNPWFHDKESAIGPGIVSGWLLAEREDCGLLVDFQSPEPSGRLHRCHCDDPPVGLMELQEFPNI